MSQNEINRSFRRASVVPYIIKDEMLWFLLGIDLKSGEVTDLGGGVKKYENELEAAYREFHEETKGIFLERVTFELLSRCVAITHVNSTVIFVNMDKFFIYKAPKEFKMIEKKEEDEISSLILVNEKNFQNVIRHKYSLVRENNLNGSSFNKTRKIVMWKKIRNFYLSVFNDELKRRLISQAKTIN